MRHWYIVIQFVCSRINIRKEIIDAKFEKIFRTQIFFQFYVQEMNHNAHHIYLGNI